MNERLVNTSSVAADLALCHMDISEEYESSEATLEAIEHHGIKGQKWGVENGPPYPLTNEQRTATQKKLNPVSEAIENYRKKAAKKKAEALEVLKEKKEKSKEVKEALKEDLRKKYDFKHMTNEELQSYINRARLEQQYKELVLPKKRKSYIKELVGTGLKTLGNKVVSDVIIPKTINKLKDRAGLGEQDTNALDAFNAKGRDTSKLTDKEIAALSKRAGNTAVVEKQFGSKKANDNPSGFGILDATIEKVDSKKRSGKKESKSKESTKETASTEETSKEIAHIVSDIASEIGEIKKSGWYS